MEITFCNAATVAYLLLTWIELNFFIRQSWRTNHPLLKYLYVSVYFNIKLFTTIKYVLQAVWFITGNLPQLVCMSAGQLFFNLTTSRSTIRHVPWHPYILSKLVRGDVQLRPKWKGISTEWTPVNVANSQKQCCNLHFTKIHLKPKRDSGWELLSSSASIGDHSQVPHTHTHKHTPINTLGVLSALSFPGYSGIQLEPQMHPNVWQIQHPP